MLTGFLELGRDLACVPVPMGPEPILYAPAPATAPSTGTVEEERPQQADDGQDSDDEHALPIGEEGEEQESAAQVRYGQIIASGYNEALVVPRPRNNDSRGTDLLIYE